MKQVSIQYNVAYNDVTIANDNAREIFNLSAPAWHYAMKRVMDVTLALSALAILSPVLILTAVIIRFDSKGPSMFTQTRWGQGGRKIKIYKFRSMFVDMGDNSGVSQTIFDDPRITRVGKIIRRFNVDELPQLINILKGDMSVVGPRCHAVGMLAAGALYEELVPGYHQRHVMRPGLTGLAQMRGWRGPTDRPAKARARIAADLYYVENFSFWLDIYIILQTIKVELTDGKGF